MRPLTSAFVTLALLASAATFAQDAENGRRLSERWCVGCHAIGKPTAKTGRVISFAAIAAKQGMNSEMIATFLMMPHSTMTNLPLKQGDAQDIAAFIMRMKN